MNLSAVLKLMYAGGLGSGCQGPNCGRHAHGKPTNYKVQFLRLDLHQPHGFPTFYHNDDKTNSHWTPDGRHLIVEQTGASHHTDALGMTVTTVHKIPKENVKYFGEDYEDPDYVGEKPKLAN